MGDQRNDQVSDQLAGAPTAPEFLAWAHDHQRQRRRHDAELAQITEHPDPHSQDDAMAQQQAWVRRRNHARQLHDSALAQLRGQGQGSLAG
ncbi:MAG: hypothetical protein VKN13_00185 [Cyanobacteriota bacterium]|nr:hypothetical protein [Cyanobacteriota bacterium]